MILAVAKNNSIIHCRECDEDKKLKFIAFDHRKAEMICPDTELCCSRECASKGHKRLKMLSDIRNKQNVNRKK